VTVIDVGQGSSALVMLPDGSSMLVDAGTESSTDAIESCLDANGVTKLDYMVLSHPHADHIGSAPEIIQEYTPTYVWLPNIAEEDTPTTVIYEDTLTALSTSNAVIAPAVTGDVLFTAGGATCTALAPQRAEGPYDDLNDYSIALRISYGDTAILLMGDAETVSEKEILASGLDLSADVLVVGHHGSASSSSTQFLTACGAKYACISCGLNNDYGFPKAETLTKLTNAGCKIYRTDTQGNITATLNGSTVSVVAGG
jgi:competence protein ComEC